MMSVLSAAAETVVFTDVPAEAQRGKVSSRSSAESRNAAKDGLESDRLCGVLIGVTSFCSVWKEGALRTPSPFAND